MVEVGSEDLSKALSEGFPPATAEKVWRLLGLLRELQAHVATRDKFTLKGGTALNVFHWPKAPRLSVDLDLMPTGFPSAAPRTSERRGVVRSLEELSRSLGYKVRSDPSEAITNLTLSYRNLLGTRDSLKVDEGPMWPTSFALVRLADAEQARIIALVRKAVGRDPRTSSQRRRPCQSLRPARGGTVDP